MVAYDVFMLIVVVAAAFRGWQKGMAWQIASLGSISLSYFVAVQFRGPVAEMISLDPPLNRIAAVLVLFLATSALVWILFQSLKQSIDHWKLGDFDRQMGAMFGLAKGLVLAALITLFAVSLLSEAQSQTILQSKSGYRIARILQRAQGIIPDEVQHVLAPYMERLDGIAGPPPLDEPLLPWDPNGPNTPMAPGGGQFSPEAGYSPTPYPYGAGTDPGVGVGEPGGTYGDPRGGGGRPAVGSGLEYRPPTLPWQGQVPADSDQR